MNITTKIKSDTKVIGYDQLDAGDLFTWAENFNDNNPPVMLRLDAGLVWLANELAPSPGKIWKGSDNNPLVVRFNTATLTLKY